MVWFLWMIAGALSAVVALFLYVIIANWVDDKLEARRRAVQSRQSSAELEMQRIVQNTISKMFDATRGYQ